MSLFKNVEKRRFCKGFSSSLVSSDSNDEWIKSTPGIVELFIVVSETDVTVVVT